MADGRIVPQAFGRGTLPVLHPTCAAARVWAELGEHEGVAVGERITWCVTVCCSGVISSSKRLDLEIRLYETRNTKAFFYSKRPDVQYGLMYANWVTPFIKSSVPPETMHEPRARSVRRPPAR